MRTALRPASHAANEFPVLGFYVVARRALSTVPGRKPARPLIGIGLGSVEGNFERDFPNADTVMLRGLCTELLGGDFKNAAKMTPRELREIGRSVVQKSNLSSAFLPGSTNTIALPFIKSDTKFPKVMDVKTASSFIKMSITTELLLLGLPSIYSCDASHYPVVALGGEVMPVPEAGEAAHNSCRDHDLIIKKIEEYSAFYDLAKEVTPARDSEYNVIIKGVMSTHPLLPSKLPKDCRVLASAPDGSPAIYAFMPYTLGFVDHPEASYPHIRNCGDFCHNDRDRFGGEEPNYDALNLWEKTVDMFVKVSTSSGNKLPVSDKALSPRIQEILDATSQEALSAVRFAPGQKLSNIR